MINFIKHLISAFILSFLITMIYLSPTASTIISFVILSLLVLAVIVILSVKEEDDSNISAVDKYRDLGSDKHADTLSF